MVGRAHTKATLGHHIIWHGRSHCLLVRHMSEMWDLGCCQTAIRAWIGQRKVQSEVSRAGVWKGI